MMGRMRIVSAALAMGLVCAGQASLILIDPTTNNGSFEYADGVLNTAKIAQWDTTPDIDNWSVWTEQSTAANDSGVELTGSATDGVMSSFMQGGNAVYNMTSYAIQEGDVFNFSWDHTLRNDRAHSLSLVYDDGGAITEIAASHTDYTGVLETISNSFTVQAGDAWIGSTVGVGFITPGSYPEVDNVRLELVPEPTTLSLVLVALATLVPLRRRSRR